MADSDELRAFSKDLTAAGSGIASKVLPVVHKGAGKIKKQMRSEMQSSTHFGRIAYTIDYSMKFGTGSRAAGGAGAIEAEIGPDKDKVVAGKRQGRPQTPGNLANIAYFGGSRGGGTVPDPKGALDAEIPHFEKALGDVLEGMLE